MVARAVLTGVMLAVAATGMTACASRAPVAAVAVAAPATCVATTIPIYFEERSDRLTAPALQALSSATQPLRGCDIADVTVVGLTQGDPTPANQQLSENRALQVTRALASQGLPAPRIEAYAGASPGAAEPMQRRTEVIIRPRS